MPRSILKIIIKITKKTTKKEREEKESEEREKKKKREEDRKKEKVVKCNLPYSTYPVNLLKSTPKRRCPRFSYNFRGYRASNNIIKCKN